MTWIITGTGASRLDLAEPSAKDISPSDIVASLSRTARFRGMGMHFFSVAQHSVLVGYLMLLNAKIVTFEELTEGGYTALPGTWAAHLMKVALLHDAAEAYVADIPSPLKQILPDYAGMERRIERTIFNRFGVTLSSEDLERLKLADIQAALIERDSIFPDNLKNWACEDQHPGYQLQDFFQGPWEPTYAAPMFAMFFANFFPEVTGHVH